MKSDAMLSKQDSEKSRLLIIKRNQLKKKLSSLRNKNKNAKELSRLQLDLAIVMNTQNKQKLILKNGRKGKLKKMLKLKRELQILKES
jgi:hypothetical protein